MKRIITAVIGAILVQAVISNATEINVMGKRFEIPSKYRAWKVEATASNCVNRQLARVQSSAAVDLLITSCVSQSLRSGDRFYILDK